FNVSSRDESAWQSFNFAAFVGAFTDTAMASIAAIRARRAEIARQLAKLQAEDDELALVEQVLRRFSGEQESAPHASGVHQLLMRPRSQREFVLDALSASDAVWLRSDQIVSLARKRWGVAISERSLRPLLSVMK